MLQREYSEELYQEFDEFVVQLKSTLDHLVSVGVPLIGHKAWTINTFGEKGQAVVKALKNNTPRRFKKAAEAIDEMLFKEHGDWLQSFIDLRDRVNHFIAGGVRYENFGVHRLRDGTAVFGRHLARQRARRRRGRCRERPRTRI